MLVDLRPVDKAAAAPAGFYSCMVRKANGQRPVTTHCCPHVHKRAVTIENKLTRSSNGSRHCIVVGPTEFLLSEFSFYFTGLLNLN